MEMTIIAVWGISPEGQAEAKGGAAVVFARLTATAMVMAGE